MRINSISKNYQTTNTYKQGLKYQTQMKQEPQPIATTVTFKALSAYEKEVQERTKEIIKEKKMGKFKQFFGGESEAREQAIKEIDKRNLDLQLDNARKDAIISEQRKFQAQRPFLF